MERIPNNHKNFTEPSFWEKIRNCPKKVGREVIEKALMLFYALGDENVPIWAKTALTSALAYFISPVDAIPDFIPGIGYADDLAVMASALATTCAYISDETIARAKKRARDLVG